MSSSPQPLDGVGVDELRAAVRAVLRDVLPAELVRDAAGVAATAPVEHVTVRDDRDLDALVRRVAQLCEDPTRRAALRDGRHGFRLAGGTPPAPSRSSATGTGTGTGTGGPSPVTSGVVRIDRGAVTERAVARAAADGARILVGPKAVLTPLARDKARVLGLQIEKER